MRDLPDDFQLEHLNAALAFIKRKGVALDIGAHRGIWSKRMSQVFEEVHAFEPNIEMFEKFSPSLNVKKYNIACGYKTGRCGLQKGERNTGQTHCVEGDDIDVIDIDSFDFKPDFIKIDVEGMEFDVLRGAKKTVLKYKPLIMIEENGLCERYGHRSERASTLLKRWGAEKLMTLHMEPEKDLNILFGWSE